MAEQKQRPGPKPGSEGATRIADAHRGSHAHDREGGFAANPDLARSAGKVGGERVKEKYGSNFYTLIGRKGGEAVRDARGPEFYSQIGKKGREERARRQRVQESAED
ncbi:MAG: hypothetical protein HY321_14405 [Armatimonadetes bacterium]|nr:hypothetical protein [Armatimonadota bacterium]